MKPQSFGSYTLLDILGRGGMGEVYLAKPKGLDRLVALKRIHGDAIREEQEKIRFADEANIAARMNHANIAQVYEYGSVDGQCYLAMEYIQGCNARHIFYHHRERGRAVPASVACHLVIKLCEALDYAHNRRDFCGRPLDFVHRDVCLGNLMLSFDGEVKLIDFGIAKASCRLTTTEQHKVCGTPAYMAPEQLQGLPLDRRSDVFSCGVVLFELLTGRRLFQANNLPELLFKLRSCKIPCLGSINPLVPNPLDHIVRRALARNPSDRYQSASALRDALLAAVEKRDLLIPSSQLANWMRIRYSREYRGESTRIARLWASLDNNRVTLTTSNGIPEHIIQISSGSVTLPYRHRAMKRGSRMSRARPLQPDFAALSSRTFTTVTLQS